MKLLVLDGNSILNRAYYGIKLLTTKDGYYTNGIYGFLTILHRIMGELTPDAVAVAFDMKAPTFRHKSYDGYKAQRKGMPEELAQQMPVLKELLTALGYKIVTCEGWEADDILGTLAKKCEETGHTCYIATGDRDSLQLVSEHTTVRLATTKFGQSAVTLYDMDKIREDYGVEPKQLIDIKAIQGDTSDNIPGAKGIGQKGASDLITKFGSVKYIYDHIDEIDVKPAMRDKLLASRENVELSYFLGTIITDAPIDTNIEAYVPAEMNMKDTAALMTKLELFSLMEKYGVNANAAVTPEVTATEEAEKITVTELSDGARILAMAEDEGKAYFVSSFDEGLKMAFAFEGEVFTVHPDEAFLKAFAGSNFKKYTHDVKPLLKHIFKSSCGKCRVKNIKMDTVLAAYLLNPSASGYDIPRLCGEYGVAVPETEEELAGAAAALPKLCEKLSAAIDENNQRELLETMEIPLAEVLADMEVTGVAVDSDGIAAFGEQLKLQIDSLVTTIYQQVGYEFNINSPKQLGKALFEDLGLPHGKKTKSGYSTSAEVLDGLRYQYPVVEDILQYRTLTKLSSTYCEGLLKVIAEDGRIHSNFNQTETRTGRISSTEPNLQNIPVRTELGREMRRFFVAREGWTLVDADYSQIELRVLAHVAEDKVMIESFTQGKDIHRATAARVFGMPEEMVTSQMRSSAKAVNFGIVYGIGAFSLSKDIGVTRKEAEDYIAEYLRNFSGVRDYMERVISTATEKGYAEDIFGRRRYLPELSSKNFNMRSFGERVARNMPIQGAAADIIKIAMIKVYERLKAEKLEAKLILQVHDELIVECPDSEAERVKSLLTEEMEKAVTMAVPMKADANIGKNWYLAKG